MSPAIALFAAGGHDRGLGHLARTATVARALQQASDPHLTLEAPDLSLDFGLDDLTNVAWTPDRSESWNAIASAAAGGATVLVSDSPTLDESDREIARRLGFRMLVHLTAEGAERYRPDVLIDTDILPAPVPQWPGQSVVSGPIFHPVRPEVVTRRPNVPWRADRAQEVLLCLGGADPGRCTERVLQLWDWDSPQLLTVVVGPAFGEARSRRLVDSAGRGANIMLSPPDFPDLLLKSDLVLTLGGLTTYEAMTLGRPCASLRWEHLSEVTDRLERAGVVATLDWDRMPEELPALCADGARLERLASTGFDAVDGAGADRIAALVLSLARTTA